MIIIKVEQHHCLGLQMLWSWSIMQQQENCNLPYTDQLGIKAIDKAIELSEGKKSVLLELNPLQIVQGVNACDEMMDYIRTKSQQHPEHEIFLNDTVLSIFELGGRFSNKIEEAKSILKATENKTYFCLLR